MQLSGGGAEKRRQASIYFIDARHAALVSTHQHSYRPYVLHFACSIWHKTYKKKMKRGKLFGWCRFCLAEKFIAHRKPCSDTRHLILGYVRETFAVLRRFDYNRQQSWGTGW